MLARDGRGLVGESQAALVAVERLGVAGYAGELEHPGRVGGARREQVEHGSRQRVAVRASHEPACVGRHAEAGCGLDEERRPALAHPKGGNRSAIGNGSVLGEPGHNPVAKPLERLRGGSPVPQRIPCSRPLVEWQDEIGVLQIRQREIALDGVAGVGEVP